MAKKQGPGIDILEMLLGDDEVVRFDNENIDMKKLREMEQFFTPKEKDFRNVAVFWDDVVQFTTLGLIDMLIDEFPEIENPVWDYDKFFYRGFENTDYLKFVKKIFLEEFDITLEDQYIKDFFKENYAGVLKRSPATSFFPTLIRCEPMYKSVIIIFRYGFGHDNMKSFADSIRNDHFSKRFLFPVRCVDYGKHECELKFLLKTKGDYDILMMQDIGKAIAYIEEAGISGMTIVGPYGHNGVNPKYFETIFGLFNSVTRGPYNSEITLYDEGLAVC